MRKIVQYSLLLIVTILLMLLVISCETTRFERTLLQADNSSLSPKLPKLDLQKANSMEIGSTNQIESSSMLYTIFRREVETNICESIGLPAGSIQIELIYHNVLQKPGFSSLNLAVLEFEVRIFNSRGEKIWSGIYSDELNDPDSNLPWVFSFSIPAANNATAKLAHQLINTLKLDIERDYISITDLL